MPQTQNPLRIIFMGTPDFAQEALRAMCVAGFAPIAVYSQPPRPKGRGQKLQNSPVQDYAEAQGIPVFTPLSLKKPEAQAEFSALQADIAIVAAYGLILPQAVLDTPRFGCINIHASLLPRWRGASPIQQSIWRGDEKTGVTLMQMDAGLDTGAMISAREMPIDTGTSAAALHDALAVMGGDMVVEILTTLCETQEYLPAVPQDDTRTCYAPLLNKEDGRVNWAQGAMQIHKQVMALNPWPGVWTQINGQVFKLAATEIVENLAAHNAAQAGEIITRDGIVMCGDSRAIKILRIQPPNKQAMDFASAVNGGYITPGEIFGGG